MIQIPIFHEISSPVTKDATGSTGPDFQFCCFKSPKHFMFLTEPWESLLRQALDCAAGQAIWCLLVKYEKKATKFYNDLHDCCFAPFSPVASVQQSSQPTNAKLEQTYSTANLNRCGHYQGSHICEGNTVLLIYQKGIKRPFPPPANLVRNPKGHPSCLDTDTHKTPDCGKERQDI